MDLSKSVIRDPWPVTSKHFTSHKRREKPALSGAEGSDGLRAVAARPGPSLAPVVTDNCFHSPKAKIEKRPARCGWRGSETADRP